MEPLATQFLAPAGYASLECDARGHGDLRKVSSGSTVRATCRTRASSSPGSRPAPRSPTRRSARSASRSAAVRSGTRPSPASRSRRSSRSSPGRTSPPRSRRRASRSRASFSYLAWLVPQSRWDPQLLAASAASLTSTDLSAVRRSPRRARRCRSSRRSPRRRCSSRAGATSSSTSTRRSPRTRRLTGPEAALPRRPRPPARHLTRDRPRRGDYWGEAVKWFDRYLKGANGIATALGRRARARSVRRQDDDVQGNSRDEDDLGHAAGQRDDRRRDRQGRAQRPCHRRTARDIRRLDGRRPLLGREELGPARRGARVSGNPTPITRRRRQAHRGERQGDDQAA